MFALGQRRTHAAQHVMSALPPDMCGATSALGLAGSFERLMTPTREAGP
jgi:hypothetical protein